MNKPEVIYYYVPFYKTVVCPATKIIVIKKKKKKNPEVYTTPPCLMAKWHEEQIPPFNFLANSNETINDTHRLSAHKKG